MMLDRFLHALCTEFAKVLVILTLFWCVHLARKYGPL